MTQLECVQIQLKKSKNLVGRTLEKEALLHFINEFPKKERNGSIYLSGNPGTGKTFLVESLIESVKFKDSCKVIKFNCMREKKGILTKICKMLNLSSLNDLVKINKPDTKTRLKKKAKICEAPSRKLKSELKKQAQASDVDEKFYFLILDEIDSLNEIDLYKLFEIANFPLGSRLALIGIANQIDLINRLAPRLISKQIQPQILTFKPYSTLEIVEIIKDAATRDKNISNASALELIARKAAACGDVRKALEIYHKTVKLDSLSHVIKTIDKLYKNPKMENLNLHQQIILKSALILTKKTIAPSSLSLSLSSASTRVLLLGELSDSYFSSCRELKIEPVNRSEFFDLISALEMNGILNILKGKDERSKKLTFNLSFDDISKGLADCQILNLLDSK